MTSLAKRLIYLREMRDLSQVTVARVLNMSPTGYFSYETGRTTPPPDIIIKLADFYKVSTDFILGYEPENKELSALISDIQKMSPENLHKLTEWVRLLKVDAAYQSEQYRRAERKQQRISKRSPEEEPQEK